MRVARGLIFAVVLSSLGLGMAGCDTFDSLEFFDTKKKLPGERKPVFPEGVPGVTQGIPPEYQKGYNEQAQPTPDPATTAVQQVAPQREVKEKPKPRPQQASKPRPRPQPAAQQAQPVQQQPQQPQQSRQPSPPYTTTSPWPQQQPQAAWPAPPDPNQFSR